MSLLDLPKPVKLEGKTKTVLHDQDGHVIRQPGDDKPGKKLSPWMLLKHTDPQKYRETLAAMKARKELKKGKA